MYMIVYVHEIKKKIFFQEKDFKISNSHFRCTKDSIIFFIRII